MKINFSGMFALLLILYTFSNTCMGTPEQEPFKHPDSANAMLLEPELLPRPLKRAKKNKPKPIAASKIQQEKPHVCTLCGKYFKLKDNLTSHIKTHVIGVDFCSS